MTTASKIMLIDGEWAALREAVPGEHVEPQMISSSEVRKKLMVCDPIFGEFMDKGWRPWIKPNGKVCLFDGTELYQEPRYRVSGVAIPPIEWVP